MITWLKKNIQTVAGPQLIHQINFLRCHVSAFLTGQNKGKKLTLDSLQAQDHQLLGLVVADHLNRVQKVA